MIEWLRRFICPQVVAQHPEMATAARVPTSTAYWLSTEGPSLAQGDFLPGCFVPDFPADFGLNDASQDVQVSTANLIIVTQSCDLENKKVAFVSLCPIYPLTEFEKFNPGWKKSDSENVRQGRREGLLLLSSPDHPENNREALVVDFRQIISLPIGYVTAHAASLGARWRLQSPYLEHFSQALARFFMRVGLPSPIPSFK